jgi:hypothetical protein
MEKAEVRYSATSSRIAAPSATYALKRIATTLGLASGKI